MATVLMVELDSSITAASNLITHLHGPQSSARDELLLRSRAATTEDTQ